MLRLPSGALIAEDFAEHVLHAELYIWPNSLVVIPKHHRRSPEILGEDALAVWKILNEGAHDVQPT